MMRFFGKKCRYCVIGGITALMVVLQVIELIWMDDRMISVDSMDIEYDFDLSFVIATRNDNHSSNPIMRLQLCLNQLILYEWKKIHDINVEINIIEWNYIEGNRHVNEYKEIKELFEYNKIHKNTVIKFYKISSKYNDTKYCDKKYKIDCPFPQYYPKNIGIRRSNGKWILITNMDDVFSIKLMDLIGHHISNNLFDINGIYQAMWDERDYSNIIKDHNINSISLLKTMYDYKNIPLRHCIIKLINHTGGVAPWSGDFTLIHRHHVFNHYVGGYLEHCSSQSLDSEFISRQIHINNLQPYWIHLQCSYIHIKHQRSTKIGNICYKMHTDYLWKYIMKHKTLQNFTKYAYAVRTNISWCDVYKTSHQTWGLHNITFDYTLY